MTPEQINALANLVKEIGIAAAAILAAFYSWRNARRSKRIEDKVDAHEEVQTERQDRLVGAVGELQSRVDSVASSVRGGEPGKGDQTQGRVRTRSS